MPLRTPHTQAHEKYCDAAYAFNVKKNSADANDHELLKEGRAITATRKVIKAYLTDTGSDWSLRHIMLKIQGDKPKLRTLPTDFEIKSASTRSVESACGRDIRKRTAYRRQIRMA